MDRFRQVLRGAQNFFGHNRKSLTEEVEPGWSTTAYSHVEEKRYFAARKKSAGLDYLHGVHHIGRSE